jgi:multidrug efflux pump subunit AcrA (membrane-fusion protein)
MICARCGADLTGVIRHECPARERRIIIPGRLVIAGLAALAIAIIAIIAAVLNHSNPAPATPVRVVTVTPHVTVTTVTATPHVTVTTVTPGVSRSTPLSLP